MKYYVTNDLQYRIILGNSYRAVSFIDLIPYGGFVIMDSDTTLTVDFYSFY